MKDINEMSDEELEALQNDETYKTRPRRKKKDPEEEWVLHCDDYAW